MTEEEKWGLEALSAAYEARKNLENGQPVDETLPPIMRSAIFFGQDLSALGMDLDSVDPIYPTFTPFPAANSTGSTFDFHDRHTIPDFQLPGAYTVNNVPPLAGRVAALSDGESSSDHMLQPPFTCPANAVHRNPLLHLLSNAARHHARACRARAHRT